MRSAIQRTWNRVRNSLAFGVITTIDDTGPVQTAQVRIGSLETRDNTPIVYHFGFTANPPAGSHLVTHFVAGARSNAVGSATNHTQLRMKGLAPGESAIYDSAGNFVYIKAGTIVAVNAKTEVDVSISGTLVGKITSAGLAITGTITATGGITAGFGGSDQITLQHHDHTYIPGSGSPTTTSAPVAGS